ncbi:MAG: DUF368 domain-containing protein [Clostridia bacterium]|nr:DUF368 domain-containing protein [Clostridia bacterium]
MKFLLDILRGLVIGLANIIPGVSGGTMMVSMGIYDTLIHSITHLFKQFKKSIMTLLPFAIGMVVAIAGLSFVITWAFDTYPLPTNTLFIGLILGGLPAIIKQLKGEKMGAVGGILFVLFFALIIVLQIIQKENVTTITLSFVEVIKLLFLGALASATMVIPGVSGSMILKLMGYYEPVIASIKGLTSSLFAGNWSSVLANVGILLPFGIGIVIGIFAIAKLIEVLIAKYKGWTYAAILGLVTASPVAILMATDMTGVTLVTVLVSLATFAVGYVVAYVLSPKEEPLAKQA